MNLSGAETLNCVYFILFGVGLGYAIIAVLLGQISHIELPHGVDVDLPGVDLHPGGPDLHLDVGIAHDISHDVDHPQVGLSPLSPITIATFITTFGGVGFLLNNFTTLSPLLGGVIAAASGLLLSGTMFLLYTRVLMAAQGSSEVQTGDYISKTGEVTAPIPQGRVGEVALVVRGSRVTMTARSSDGSAIPRGALVTVTDVVGGVLVVRPREEK
jgi:membrane protein implicated in regulation of membrane protease activity